jgi:hypothetical protein
VSVHTISLSQRKSNMRVVCSLLAAAAASGSVVSAWTTAITATASRSASYTTPNTCSFRTAMTPLRATSDDGVDEAAAAAAENEPAPSLLLGNDIEQQMATLRSKYPTTEADYLSAARARSAAKAESTSHGNEEDWKTLAAEKKRAGEVMDDAWEASKLEAGNADSQILIPMLDTDNSDNDSDGDPEEPKLLLW